ncbi:MAG: PAS domain S-box protein [Thermodesulfobacteriota bacterium]
MPVEDAARMPSAGRVTVARIKAPSDARESPTWTEEIARDQALAIRLPGRTDSSQNRTMLAHNPMIGPVKEHPPLYRLPEILSDSHVSSIFMRGSQTGGTGVPPVIVEREKRTLSLVTAVTVLGSSSEDHPHRGGYTVKRKEDGSVTSDRVTRHEELLDTVLDAIPTSVLVMDLDLRIVLANRNFLKKSKMSKKDVVGEKIEHILPQPIVDNTDLVRNLRQVIADNKPINGERMTYRAPGIPIRNYFYSILPFSRRGKIENAVLLMEDVTEQIRLNGEVRRIERHLASVVENAMDIMLSTDYEGRILTWNNAAERLSGYKVHQVKGTVFSERICPNHREDFLRVFDTLRAEDTMQTGEWDLSTSTGSRLPISWVLSPMRDANALTIGVVGVGRDLSERRKLEAQLLQAQKLSALGVMADGIAHEIRNPLAICSSAAQMLLEEDISPELSKACVKKILAGIQRATITIENLLRFARPSPTTDMHPVDLVGAIQSSLDLVQHRAKIHNTTIRAALPQTPLLMRGDAGQIQQVFLNLFLNAIASMPDGGELRVAVERVAEELVARVEDTGRGMSQEVIRNIFDPFFTLSPVGKGVGLGLSICYSIVEQHFGRIEVQSEIGQGATFTLRFPALSEEGDT